MIWFKNLWDKIRHKKLEEREESSTVQQLKLIPELVPAPLWGKSLANLARKSIKYNRLWRAIQRKELMRSGGRCEYCGSTIGLSVHEVWDYDDIKCVQKLIGFKVSCKHCSLVNHFGFASVNELDDVAFEHFMQINSLSRKEAEKLISEAFKIWQKRSSYKNWSQDFSWLIEKAQAYGIDSSDITEIEIDLQNINSPSYCEFLEQECELLKLPLVGHSRANLLKKVGIRTINDLLSYNLQDLVNHQLIKSSKILPSSQLKLIYYYAKAIKEASTIIVGDIPVLKRNDISYLDLEYDPGQPFIFILGIMDKNGNLIQWFIEDEHQEKEVLTKFANMSKERVYLTYCGKAADLPILIKCFQKHKISFVKNFNIIDLFYDIIEPRNPAMQKIFLPLKERSEKEVARYLGFVENPKLEIRSGLEALLKFGSYLKTTNINEKAIIKKQLLLYNEEDLRRTKYIFEKLQEILNLTKANNYVSIFS